MSEEEKEAIEMLDKFITEHKLYNIKQSDGLEDNIKIVLNLIEELNGKVQEQKKLLIYKTDKIEKQEKVIDEMAKAVYDYANLGTMGICPAEIENGCINFDLCEYFGKKDINCLKCVKQYFYRKVENNE